MRNLFLIFLAALCVSSALKAETDGDDEGNRACSCAGTAGFRLYLATDTSELHYFTVSKLSSGTYTTTASDTCLPTGTVLRTFLVAGMANESGRQLQMSASTLTPSPGQVIDRVSPPGTTCQLAGIAHFKECDCIL